MIWLIAAVLGGVAYGVYEASKSAGELNAAPPTHEPSPIVLPQPAGPGVAASPRLVEIVNSGHVTLETGVQYLAVVHTTGIVNWFASAEKVQQKMQDMGLSAVFVWSSDPPSYFPVRTAQDGGSTYWAQGFFQRSPQSVDRPSDIVPYAWVNRGAPIFGSAA